jgi:hypothetical protein
VIAVEFDRLIAFRYDLTMPRGFHMFLFRCRFRSWPDLRPSPGESQPMRTRGLEQTRRMAAMRNLGSAFEHQSH